MRKILLVMALCVAMGCSGEKETPSKGKRDLKAYEWDNSPAPDTAGKDSEKRELRLSDYKGKVVLLDFWATWCPPCRELIPHEKKLFSAYKDKPFVLLGISGDDSYDRLNEFEKAEGINWRSIRDGRWGPIHREWTVQAVPTIFLIDHEGKVRYRFQGADAFKEEDVKAAIEELLKQVPGQ